MVAVQFLEMRNLGHSGLLHPRSKTLCCEREHTENAKTGGEVNLGKMTEEPMGDGRSVACERRELKCTGDKMAVR